MIPTIRFGLGSTLSVALVLCGCATNNSRLLVDVRSDFVAGVEAVEVDVVVETRPDATNARRTLGPSDNQIGRAHV